MSGWLTGGFSPPEMPASDRRASLATQVRGTPRTGGEKQQARHPETSADRSAWCRTDTCPAARVSAIDAAMPIASPATTSARPCAQHQSEHALAARAERHAHAELLHALRHRRGDHAADAAHRHQQRQHGEHGEQRRGELRRRQIAVAQRRRASGCSRPACSDRPRARPRGSAWPRASGSPFVANQEPPGEPLRLAAAACRPARSTPQSRPNCLTSPTMPTTRRPGLAAVERDARADRVAVVPVAHHRLVDDRDRRRVAAIEIGERAPLNQRNAERREVIAA